MVDVLIGDRHFLFVDLLSSLLIEYGYGSVASTADPQELVAEVRRRAPRVCLVDHRSFPVDGGSRLLEALVGAAAGRSKIVVVSTGRATPEPADTAEALGVDGVFDKRTNLRTLLDGLRLVLDGEIMTVAPVPTQRAPGWETPRRRDAPTSPEDTAWYRRLAASLTPRERECLALLVDGQGTEQIQHSLSVSVMTVRSHVRSLLRKLGAHSRLEAASLAVRYELLTDGLAGSRAG